MLKVSQNGYEMTIMTIEILLDEPFPNGHVFNLFTLSMKNFVLVIL